jgi:hypothetical protein
VAGSCEYGAEPSGFGATELVIGQRADGGSGLQIIMDGSCRLVHLLNSCGHLTRGALPVYGLGKGYSHHEKYRVK